jgi:hypothetical protein
MQIASYILNRFQKTGDLSRQTVWITVEAVKRPASWKSSKSERTEHLRRSFEVVKGRHAAGGEAMRRDEASELETFFRCVNLAITRRSSREHFCFLRISQNRNCKFVENEKPKIAGELFARMEK